MQPSSAHSRGLVVSIWHDVVLFSPSPAAATPRSTLLNKLPALPSPPSSRPSPVVAVACRSTAACALTMRSSTRGTSELFRKPASSRPLSPNPAQPHSPPTNPSLQFGEIFSAHFPCPLSRSATTFGDTSDDPFAEPDAVFPVILDNASLEAVEVGARERDPGDVFPVLPLLALPVRLQSGLGSEVLWKLVVVEAVDPQVEAGETAAVAATALPQVKALADTGGFTTMGPDPWRILKSPQCSDANDWVKSARKALRGARGTQRVVATRRDAALAIAAMAAARE
ncbi:unnamed protein product [Closterium sp. Yama58-4]|nr:unnamed protein product [Closterium sp. Yama58-4]